MTSRQLYFSQLFKDWSIKLASLLHMRLVNFTDVAAKSPHPYTYLSKGIATVLARMAEKLDEQGLVFEAGSTEDLAQQFLEYSKGEEDENDFISLWQELEDWSETSVYFDGREKNLCQIPKLPISMER